MNLLTLDLRPFKSDMHALLSAADTSTDAWDERLHADIVELVRRHRVPLDALPYANHVVKYMRANNAQRAHKLVDCLEDHSVTKARATLLLIGIWVTRWSLVAGFILLVVWAYHRCAGG